MAPLLLVHRHDSGYDLLSSYRHVRDLCKLAFLYDQHDLVIDLRLFNGSKGACFDSYWAIAKDKIEELFKPQVHEGRHQQVSDELLVASPLTSLSDHPTRHDTAMVV